MAVKPKSAMKKNLKNSFKKYLVSILVESDNPKSARESIETFGLKAYEVKKVDSIRTLNQNSALHLYCEMVEEHCAEIGLTVEKLYKKPSEIKITRDIVKSFIRETGMYMFHRDSTAKLEKNELSEVIRVVEKVFAERLDFTLGFPSIESLINNPST